MKITVIGNSNTEIIIKAPFVPGPGETAIGETFSMLPGGRGAHQAVAAARAGGDVTFVSRIGNDMFGEQAVQMLQQDGINTSFVIKDHSTSSGVASIIVDSNGESGITLSPGANLNLSQNDILGARDAIVNADLLLLQLDIPLDTVKFAAGLARSAGIRVILNPAPALPVSDEILKSISVLTPDSAEAELLTGITITDERSAELAGRILLERGLDRVIITLRSKGAMVIDNGGAEHVPGFKVKTVDKTAVNDVFNGALAVGLAEGKNFYEAVLFANAAAAISYSRTGTKSSIPFREEILDVIRTVKRSH
ncbi:MAG TPA: ribokinase [Bacteroidales bacterium]|nr:ribokinase [Bacteroidales bacterium]